MRQSSSELKVDEGLRSWLRSQVDAASDIVAPLWPLRTFVAVHPLVGLEHRPFHEAVQTAGALLGGEGYLSAHEYRELYHAGRITSRDVAEALALVHPQRSGGDALIVGPRRIAPTKVLWAHLVYGLEAAEPLDARSPARHRAPAMLPSDLPAAIRARLLRRAQGDPDYRPPDPGRDLEAHCTALLWSAVLQVADALAQEEPEPATHADPEKRDPPTPRPAQIRSEGLLRELPQIGERTTLGEWCHDAAGVDIPELVDRQMIKWCAAFLDEGQAKWPMPHRERGFYSAWRTLAAYDLSARWMGVQAPAQRVRALPSQPEDALVSGLQALGVPEDRWANYLRRHLARLPGWAGFIRWRSENPPDPGQVNHPIDLLQYLAIRIFYEAELVDGVCRRTWGIAGNLTAMETYGHRGQGRHAENPCDAGRTIRSDARMQPLQLPQTAHPTARAQPERRPGACAAHRPLSRRGATLLRIAQFLGLSPTEVRQLPLRTVRGLLDLVDSFPAERQRPVWQEAYETHYRRSLLRQLSGPRPGEGDGPADSKVPFAQAAFCIDARSEGLRRHLEAVGRYETLGIAGFFGIPMRFRPLDSREETASCPVLIKPTRVVPELPRGDRPRRLALRRFHTRWLHMAQSLFQDLKGNLVTPYVLVEAVGGLFSLPLVGRTLWPRAYSQAAAALRNRFAPSVATVAGVDRAHGTDAEGMPATSDGLDAPRARRGGHSPLHGGQAEEPPAGERSVGFTTAEQADLVDDALRVMGRTRGFAQLVVLVGHGSTTENNPHAASLDCGACGGNRGGANARVLASMANRSAVRALLRGRGVAIPDDTCFLAAEHDTATDRVTLFDLAAVPAGLGDAVARLANDLEQAGARLSLERIQRLPMAPRGVGPSAARRHMALRSADWAQVRPEWGLARNAAFVIAERKWTQQIDLDGRCFLHSYDHLTDVDGKALEAILTGPLVVAAWINLQYYFSSVDNRAYGSGSKVVHNVVGGIGVMLGNRSDLRAGLPLQAVMDGANRYHEPMRLLTLIHAPVERIAHGIGRNPSVAQLLRNGWVTLVAWDPGTRGFHRYRPDGRWDPLPGKAVRR